MVLNTGVLTSNRTADGDEQYTPFYACDPIVKYIPKDWTIWCPCDEEWSAYVRLFEEKCLKGLMNSESRSRFYYR